MVTIDFVRSSQNLANPLTKGLASDLVFKKDGTQAHILKSLMMEPQLNT